ncbi:MAG TPA: VOC family protein [Gammaproteobacteria bacterium]|nr:VOC family protein [Gammaproteobacteria bacterium]
MQAVEPSPRFHLAILVRDLAAARSFYGDLLGCAEGRSSESWVDFDLGGHQLVCHQSAAGAPPPQRNPVDGDPVPVPHFGLVFGLAEWRALADRLEARGVAFALPPHIRFAGTAGEQGTFFLHDPSGNALEFKGFADLGRVFQKF